MLAFDWFDYVSLCFSRIAFVNLFFFFLFFALADVISEGVIVKWYEEAHSNKGKIMFLQQMKQFKEWLETAEEGKWKMSCSLRVVASSVVEPTRKFRLV